MIPSLQSPLGNTLDRYLLRQFFGIFCATLLVVMLLHLAGDIFNRVDNFMGSNATLSTAIWFFIYRLPLMVSRVIGFAALFAAFLTLGSLARRHELVAMGACGISTHRFTLPFMLAALGISAAAFLWNETAVPPATRLAKQIYDVEVHRKQRRSVFGDREIWMRSRDAFIRADHFETETNRLHGLVIYRITPEFTMKGLIEAPAAAWNGARWVPDGGTEWRLLEGGAIVQRPLGSTLTLAERPEDFRIFARSPDEFSYFELRRRIADLRDKGIDTVRDRVHLHTKLAIPLVTPIIVLLAVAFAVKPGRKGNLALNFGLTIAIGFSYWILLGFCVSLGKAGAMQPWLAAWLPNMLTGLLSLYLYTGSE